MTSRDIDMRTVLVAVVLYVALSARTAPALAEDCSKGLLWPFMRSAGECLTQTEKSQGLTGVYGAGSAAQESPIPAPVPPALQPDRAVTAAAPSSREILSPVPAASAAAASTQVSTSTPTGNTASPSCQKGWLWPFVREPGDCLTDQDRKNGIAR